LPAEPFEVVAGAPPDTPDPVGEVLVAAGAPLPLAVGWPKRVAPLGTGPIPAEADAPIPTSPFTVWLGVPLKLLAVFWKVVNVFPDVGALIAPTIPAAQ